MKQHGQGGKNGDKGEQWHALDAAGCLWQQGGTADWLLAIDDTDNLESRGTGFRARELALLLMRDGLARVRGITRHQLLVDPRIPYTSHNSSACLALERIVAPETVFDFACEYLLRASADGSDAGVVLVGKNDMPAGIIEWGRSAQRIVLQQADALALAARHGIRIAGLTGTGGGVIGALAATGLHATGNDGRFLWLKSLRSLAQQHRSARELLETTGAIAMRHPNPDAGAAFEAVPADDLIALGNWPRAVFLHHQPVLFVENNDEPEICPWRVVDRELIKRY
ncbi:hypothetical protein [Noviherbaspirillum pedocola]|uniref:Uncharacterized protein n=1 Tax=Noviherbaspirillum pedocola TaxID=2801341 RepID=A0A934T160_9BURK|nr:hypothetical protein [Noviherbaspirillum pedocola]MBK4735548.1 hypothetical protein [Noviherbaspirillum pedocola]